MSATNDPISQRDCLGTVSTIYKGAGWHVVDLHANKANPRQVSGPDLMMLRDGEHRVAKCMARAKDKLSEAQEKMRRVYEAAGFHYHVYSSESFRDVAEDAES